MRLRQLLLPAILGLAANSAAAAGPFVPPGVTPPDYVATMTTKSFGKDGSMVVMRHGGRTRISAGNNGANASYHLDDPDTSISLGDRSRTFRRGAEPSPIMDEEPRNTGERQKHLGEDCTVWETKRSNLHAGFSFHHLSCVTDDGIELWNRLVDHKGETPWSIEATQIERRAVAPQDVEPARALLAFDWSERKTPTTAVPDHETIMTLTEGSRKSETTLRTVRRHGAWRFHDEIVGKRRRIAIMQESNQMRLDYESDESGPPKRMTVMIPLVDPADIAQLEAAKRLEPRALDKAEIVLGEPCRWFDMTPGMADAGHVACLTSDGIALKESFSSRLSSETWTAVSLTRRPIAIDEVKPPAELLMPQTWGIQ